MTQSILKGLNVAVWILVLVVVLSFACAVVGTIKSKNEQPMTSIPLPK